MATRFSVPASPKKDVLVIDNFLGVDLTNSGANIAETRSPNAPNMIRDVPGKVRKRTGYRTVKDFREDFGEGVIYGVHIIKNNSEATIFKRNLCSVRSLNYRNLAPGDSIYIYSNENCLPAGCRVHIQFKYRITGILDFSPYYEDKEYVELRTVNTESQFYANYSIYETTNAFEITNNTQQSVDVVLSDVMVYLVEADEAYNGNYSSYTEINENKLYSLGNDNPLPDVTGSGSTVDLSVNSTVYGMVLASFTVYLSNISGVVRNLEIGFKSNRDGQAAIAPPVIKYSAYQSSGYKVTCVLDPAINHTLYDIDNSYISDITVNLDSITADIVISDIHFRNVTLKTDFDTQDYTRLIHKGNMLILEVNGQYSLLSEDMNKARSSSWQNEKKLYIIDGKNYLIYDNDDYSLINPLNEIPVYDDNGRNKVFVPTLTISKSPTGGGVSYQDLNLLTPAFIEQFLSDEDSTSFQLSFDNLDTDKEVRAWVLDGNGDFIEKQQDIDFTVDTDAGIVTFLDAPGETPVTGEDNVKILAYKTFEGYMDKVNGCTVGALFGVNGAADRLFLSGNPSYLNYDWHSEQYRFDYFPDTGYSKLGSDSSAIIGYSIVNNYLATHKDDNDPSQAVIIREGDLVVSSETVSNDGKTTLYDQEPTFKIINTLQGAGAVCRKSFATLQTEPVFLTKSGIFAITPQDITGEKYSQNRSFYINGRLLSEDHLEDAYAIVHDDMYMLFINSHVYILDGLQATQTDRGAPYATRQYAAFFLTNIAASIAWVENDEIWFGTTDGRLCKFYNDKQAVESYNDDGQAIESWWETCDLDGKLFYKNKTFRYIAVRLKSNIMSRVKIWAQTRGIWTFIKESNMLSNLVFKFSELSFSGLTFNNDTSDPVISAKLRVKKIDKARFKIENSNYNEPFGIQNIALEYVQGGNFKG